MSVNITKGNFKQEGRFMIRKFVANVQLNGEKLNLSTDLHGSLIIEGKGGNYCKLPVQELLQLIQNQPIDHEQNS